MTSSTLKAGEFSAALNSPAFVGAVIVVGLVADATTTPPARIPVTLSDSGNGVLTQKPGVFFDDRGGFEVRSRFGLFGWNYSKQYVSGPDKEQNGT